MSQEPKKKWSRKRVWTRTNEQRSRNHFIGFVVAAFATAIANAFVPYWEPANYFSMLFVVLAIIQLYLSYKLTL